MSVYRSMQRALTNDVFATPVKEQEQGAAASVAQSPAQGAVAAGPGQAESAGTASARFVAQRSADQPRNLLLDHATRWAATLPIPARPHALMREFPRIANMIALLWTEPTSESFYEYMNSLLVDHRGGRKGFPPAVLHDLLELRDLYDTKRFRR